MSMREDGSIQTGPVCSHAMAILSEANLPRLLGIGIVVMVMSARTSIDFTLKENQLTINIDDEFIHKQDVGKDKLPYLKEKMGCDFVRISVL